MVTMALPQLDTDGSERRVAPRSRIFKRAQILTNNRFSTVDCIVRNISATGALLTIDPAVPLPKEFEVRIGEDASIRPAKLVYRREMFAGIHFLDVAPNAEDEVRVAPALVAVTPVQPSEPLRIQARALPHGIVSRLPWVRG